MKLGVISGVSGGMAFVVMMIIAAVLMTCVTVVYRHRKKKIPTGLE